MQAAQQREMDWNALMRAVLLMAFTAFLIRLFVRDEIGMYIHHRFKWFTITAGVGMVLMAIGQFARAIRGTRAGAPIRGRLYIAFAAVLAVGFLLRPHTFQADLATKQGLNVTSLASASEADPVQPQAPAPAVSTPKPQETKPVETPKTEPSQPPESATALPFVKSDGHVALTITSENFVRSMMIIYGNHVEWAGKRIAVDGFVFSTDDLPPEEFGFARLVVTCHVAHASPQGFVAYDPSGKRPADDSWHRIEGVLEPTMYQGQSTLRLRVEKIAPIAKPSDPYVYG